MRLTLLGFLFISSFLSIGKASAQTEEDPTAWQYEVKKKGAGEYQLVFHLKLKEGWHIWSLNPGGDGFQIVPSFAFDNAAGVQMKGKPSEHGKATTTEMGGVDGKVTYLSGKVDYIQVIATKAPARISGRHTYQVCNDRMCLAPVDKDFVFDVR